MPPEESRCKVTAALKYAQEKIVTARTDFVRTQLRIQARFGEP